MKKIFVLLAFLPIMVSAQTRDYFTNLVEFNHKNLKHSGAYALPSSLPATGIPIFDEEYEASYPLVFPIISSNQKDKILVCYSEGPSADPNFGFWKKNSDGNYEQMFSLAGEEIFFPGNGYIYTICRSNNNFTKRDKFYFNGTEAVLINQPYYYVGLKTKTLKNVTIYADYECNKELAVIAVDSDIEILIADFSEQNSKYLIKTPFGLVGWWRMDREYPGSEEVGGLWYAGD